MRSITTHLRVTLTALLLLTMSLLGTAPVHAAALDATCLGEA